MRIRLCQDAPPRLSTTLVIAAALIALGFLWSHALNQNRRPILLWENTSADPPKPLDLSQKKVIRILSINGGGARGIIPLMALADLESRTGKPALELFDLFTGISIGGVVAVGVLLQSPCGDPLYSAEELLQRFTEEAPSIFNPPTENVLITLDGLLGPKYSSKHKNALLMKLFGPTAFGQLQKPCMLLGFNLATCQPETMENWRAPWHAFPAIDILNVSTNFPGISSPVFLKSQNQNLPMIADMGLVEMDPSLLALQRVRKIAPDAQIILINLGTGGYALDENSASISRWDEMRWISTLFPTIASGSIAVTQRNMRAEQATLGPERLKYYVVDVPMPPGLFCNGFDASPQNLADIQAMGNACLKQNAATLNEIAALLVQADD
ncbi:hypothetical protein DB345_17020 [Spartobacteria bacterium LR76]|nr:hypothetical protein DB345_17020 [Spartobacteria bacterium LR76]